MTRQPLNWTVLLCVAMVCAAWVLVARSRQPEQPVTLTVAVTRPSDVAPTVRALGLPALEVRR